VRHSRAALKLLWLVSALALLGVTSAGAGVTVEKPTAWDRARLRVPVVDAPTDWPQVQRDPQRTGFTPEVLGTSFEVVWTHPFQPEKVYPQVQAIVHGGRIFVGTEMGNLYALDAHSGALAWVYPVGAPILNSVAAENGKVFFGAMDGAVYGLDAASGSLVWRSQLSWRLGFSTAPVLAEQKVVLGGRNGVVFALDQETGATLWQYDVGAPILQTAAWNNGRAYFGAMNMRVYALNTLDGSLAWKSDKLDGMAFKDYWPVVYDGYILIRPMGLGGIDPGFPFDELYSPDDPGWTWVMEHGPTIAEGNLTDIAEAMEAQDSIITAYEANPDNYIQNLYILDEATGTGAMVVPHWTGQTMNGATTPPCVDRDGTLVVPARFIRSGWGRLDLSVERVTDLLYDHTDWYGGTMDPGDLPAGMGNIDENLNVTCTGNLVLAMHTEEYNANYTGAFDLDNRRWISIGPGPTSQRMSTNTQGGGGNPASVADGMVYHISFNELIARSTEP
jgi:hypothetical protein